MRSNILKSFIFFVIMLAPATGPAAADKPIPRIEKLKNFNPERINLGPATAALRAGDTCTVYHGGEITYFIYPWVIGNELYKAYQDPSLTCDAAYPFDIYEVILGLYVLEPAIIQVSMDVEQADMTNPACPRPGLILTITSLYQVALDTGLYFLTVPLDSVITVNGPYFVGAYFADAGNPSSTAILTDNIPVPCVSYNDWGEGYVDLDTVHNEGLKVFPGRLVLLSTGSPGGSGDTQPIPAAQFIHPSPGQYLGSTIDLWVNDVSGSDIIDRALFQYNRTGTWIDIGYDFADDPPLRNGVTTSGSGDGLSLVWNTTGLPEDSYQLRTIILDTLGRADTNEISVEIDPTSPTPIINVPAFAQNICGGTTFDIGCTDEDISYMVFDLKNASRDFSIAMPLISQQLGGDTNGSPGDGNSAATGEYGDYCSGPASAAMACKYWYFKGYTNILSEGSATLTDAQLIDRMFLGMHVEDNLGTFDGEYVSGLREYCLLHGNQFDLKIDRQPEVATLRSWIEDFEYAVTIGLSGNPGLWLTLTGAVELGDEFNQYTFSATDPSLPGPINLQVKDEAEKLWALYNSQWVEVDIMLGLVPSDWSVSRSTLGFDQSGGDGWGLTLDASSLNEDSLYFLYVRVVDQLGHSGFGSILIENDCQISFMPGDVNNDGLIDLADLVYLTAFLYSAGPAPAVGYNVADINCDGTIDLADVIYLYKFLFFSGPVPCP